MLVQHPPLTMFTSHSFAPLHAERFEGQLVTRPTQSDDPESKAHQGHLQDAGISVPYVSRQQTTSTTDSPTPTEASSGDFKLEESFEDEFCVRRVSFSESQSDWARDPSSTSVSGSVRKFNRSSPSQQEQVPIEELAGAKADCGLAAAHRSAALGSSGAEREMVN